MKFIISILTLSLFVSCTNEPLKPYNLNKTELKNAQKAYENSTIQHQKVQSKSIITITKNETKVLAMIEIFQNWKLDSLEERFEPIEEEAKAVLTYFQNYFQIKPHVFKVGFDDITNEYYQSIDININYGISKSDILNRGTRIPIITEFNGFELERGNGKGYSDRHELTFNSKIIEFEVIKLITSYNSNRVKQFGEDVFKVDFEQFIITNLDKIQELDVTRQQL